MLNEKKWQDVVKLAKHYKAIGNTEIYLSRCDGDELSLPWQFVVKVEPGGTHRLDIATSVYFHALHPCGLTFRWSMDLEDRDANGRGHYLVDVKCIERVMALLPARARSGLQSHLAACAQAVAKSAQKYAEIADRERMTAASLAVAATGH